MDELKKASRQRGVCVDHLKRCKTSYSFNLVQFYFVLAGGTGVTLVPVPTKTARSHSDIKGRRPFDVPASNFIFVSIFCYGTWLTQEPPSRFFCQPFALFYLLHCCRNLALFYFILDFTASEPSSEQGRREFTSH